MAPHPLQVTASPPLSGLSPEELALRAQQGSLAAYGELVRRFQDRLYSFLLRRCASSADAEDLAQDTFLRAWRRINLYRPTNKFSTWLFTIAARLASSHRRTSARRAARRPEPASTTEDYPWAAASRVELRSRIWEVVDRTLGADPRTILWLRYAEGLSMKEIAAVMGKSQVGVRVSLFRSREALAAALAEHVESSPVAPRGCPREQPLPGGVH